MEAQALFCTGPPAQAPLFELRLPPVQPLNTTVVCPVPAGDWRRAYEYATALTCWSLLPQVGAPALPPCRACLPAFLCPGSLLTFFFSHFISPRGTY
jgi:hypothetical protein